MTSPDRAPRAARRPLLSIPAAIVAAGALVGLGLYLGLRDGSGALRPARVEWTPAPSSAAPPAASAPPVLQGSYPSDALRASVEAAAAEQLAAVQPELRRACWEPSVARAAAPASLTLQARITFDAAGRATAVAVSDPPDGARLDVAACVREATVALQVPPPGMRVTAAIPLHFPDPRP